jgi:LysM repeat protein
MSSQHNLAFDEVPRGDGRTGATEQIARALRESGIDAPSGLFDEALTLAQEGHLSPAAERLRMLLCLDPTDADAALLLGKILASRGQYQEALANLDLAATHGAVLPAGLRDRVEAGLRKQISEAEDHRNRVAARERGEVHTLRAEAKKLRSENAVLELEVDELQRRVRLWSGATAVIAGVAAALVLATLVFGGEDEAKAGGSADSAVAAAEELVISPTPETVAASAASGTSGVVSTKAADKATDKAVEKPTDKASATTETVKTASVVPSSTSATSGGAKTHVVKKGDTLGGLASKYYGDSSKWPLIQAANKDKLKGSVDLKLDMKLVIPPAT